MAYKLLLADDEPGILRVLGIYLRDAGFIVDTVGNGKEAAGRVETGSFDIVLTDIRMPGMDGIRLLKHIKRVSKNTEVIMITGHGDFKLAIQSLKLDAVDFIPKPIDNDILDIALKRAVDRIETRKQLEKYTTGLEQLVRRKTVQLDTSQKRYAQLFNESPSFITIQDKDLNIVETNRMFTRHIRFEPGMACYQAYKKRSSPCGNCPVIKTFEDGKSHHAEMEIIRKDGRLRRILIQTSGVVDAKGRLTHVMEMATDVTMIHDLQDHLASLGLHIGSISHGIKQLLTGVDGGSYLLESGLKKNDPALIQEGWDIVKNKITDIRQTVLDILFQAKHREPDRSSVTLSEFIDELAQSIAPKAREKGIGFDVQKPDKAVKLIIDRQAVRAAFMSVLENAVDACAPDSTRPHCITFTTTIKNRTLISTITDTGPGLEAGELDKIFDPFYSKKGNKGTGLGLFIAQRTIKQHKGSIHVASVPVEDTRFTIRLPLAPDES